MIVAQTVRFDGAELWSRFSDGRQTYLGTWAMHPNDGQQRCMQCSDAVFRVVFTKRTHEPLACFNAVNPQIENEVASCHLMVWFSSQERLGMHTWVIGYVSALRS